MLKLLFLIACLLPVFAGTSFPEVDGIIEEAVSKNVLPGGVTIAGTSKEVLQKGAYGTKDLIEDNTTETIYDLASLTKVVATATSIMVLEEQGKLKVTDKVSLYFSEFNTDEKRNITIEDLMRHHSGLPASTTLVPGETFVNFIKRVASTNLEYDPGTKMVYSDLGFIVLGELVERLSGSSLDEFTKKHIYVPLKMMKTGFSVREDLKAYCAPTRPERACAPHDPKAFQFWPHNAGHAGVFSTVEDLSRFARMYLNCGSLEGITILKCETVKKMVVLSLNETRGLGWDLLSPYANAPRGDIFAKGISYGHTGFTGTTIWIDPATDSYYVFLSNRVLLGEDNTAAPFTKLRRAVSTAIASSILKSFQ